MLDKRYLRDNAEEAKAQLAKRGAEFAALVDEFVALDVERRKTQTTLDELKQQQNQASKQIGALMKADKRDEAEAAKGQVRELKERVNTLDAEFKQFDERERELLLSLPNLPSDTIPEGGEECAEVVKETGEPRTFSFEPLDHLELCQRLGLVNFEAGARISGSGFPVMIGQGALLQRALINLMLTTHTVKHGYTEVRPPLAVHPRCAFGTGNLPKFADDMYHVTVADQAPPEDIPPGLPHLFLIPTAEMPVCNYYREQLLEAPTLPIKFTAFSPCWRVEAGSYGKEARGLTRLHQFDKVELVRVADPASSWDELEELTSEAEFILETLGLPYRRKVLPTGDMAFGSAKTYDLEVYCATEGAWREVSSASNTTDYQARRMNLRFRREKGAKPEYPHLLNASGTALPRLVIAVLEYYQNEDGTVSIPEVLVPFMGGVTELVPQPDAPPLI